MLHIDRVRNRLAENPEPPQVAQMRAKILEAFHELRFEEKAHRYTIPRGRLDMELPSVSTLVGRFEPLTDWDAIRRRYAQRHGLAERDVERAWREKNIRSTNNGTSTHLYGEWCMRMALGRTDFDPVIAPQYQDGYLIPYSPKQEAVEKFWDDAIAVRPLYPLLPEARMFMPPDNGLGIPPYAGTADMLFAFNREGRWETLLMDYKTNAALANDYNREHGRKLLAPFGDMAEEPLSAYTIQLSLYQLMLENIGIPVADRRIVWLKEDGNYEKIPVPHVGSRLVQYFKESRGA